MAMSNDLATINSDFRISFIDEIKKHSTKKTEYHSHLPQNFAINPFAVGDVIEHKKFGVCDGKGLFATKNYLEGEIIFEEEPLVSCQFLWNKEYGYLACDSCMRPLETPEENARRLTQNYELSLPYPELFENLVNHVQCSLCGVSYCCESCKEKAWDEYHEILCLRSLTPDPNHPLVLLQETWKQMHYPPESASIMLLARIIAIVRQSEDKDRVMKRILNFCHHTTNEEETIAHKLLGQEFRDQLEKLRILMEKALGGKDVYHWLTPDGFRSLFALVGTNGQGVGTSPLSVWVTICESLKNISEDEKKSLNMFIDDLYGKLDEVVGGFLNSEGSGLYCIQSCCNHSCVPNASVSFPHNNFRLVLKATSDIKEGDEICISYLDECDLGRSRHSRQKILRDNYIFSCKCSKCEEQKEDPDVTSEEEESSDDDSDDEDME